MQMIHKDIPAFWNNFACMHVACAVLPGLNDIDRRLFDNRNTYSSVDYAVLMI